MLVYAVLNEDGVYRSMPGIYLRSVLSMNNVTAKIVSSLKEQLVPIWCFVFFFTKKKEQKTPAMRTFTLALLACYTRLLG